MFVKGKGQLEDYTNGDKAAKMNDYSLTFEMNPPWKELTLRGKCAAIIICSGITSIGDYSFMPYPLFKSVLISDGVEHLGFGAFWKCKLLSCVYIPNSVK